MFQRQADVIEPIEQAVFAEGLHVERKFFALRFHNHLAFQIDGELVAGEGGHFVEQLGHLGFGQDDGQDAVFEAVVEKDVGVAGGDQGAKTVLFDGPGRVFAAGAAAEVLAGQQDGGARIAWLVEHEIGVGLALGDVFAGLAFVEVAPLVKQVGAETGLADRLQKLLGDDGVGVDVFAVHGGHGAFDGGEFVHAG